MIAPERERWRRRTVDETGRSEHPPRFDGVVCEGLLLLSRSFEGFLERIADDWEHFVSQDMEWD